jgi:predicted Ser/Thr protein kinase
MKHTLPVDVFLQHIHNLAHATPVPTAKRTRRRKLQVKIQETVHDDDMAERLPKQAALRVPATFTMEQVQAEGELAPPALVMAFGYTGVVTAAAATAAIQQVQSKCFGHSDAVKALIGQGVSAVVFAAYGVNGWFALKLFRPASSWLSFRHEAVMQQEAAAANVAPRIMCEDYENGTVRMQLLTLTLEEAITQHGGLKTSVNLVIRTATTLLIALQALQLTHGDLHLANIAFRSRQLRQPMLLDFGKATRPASPGVDVAMLAISLRRYAATHNEESMLPVYLQKLQDLLRTLAPSADVDLKDENATLQLQQVHLIHLAAERETY